MRKYSIILYLCLAVMALIVPFLVIYICAMRTPIKEVTPQTAYIPTYHIDYFPDSFANGADITSTKADDIKQDEILIKDEAKELHGYEEVLAVVEEYINIHLKSTRRDNAENYIPILLDGYLQLFLSEEDKKMVVFYIALCHQESHFDHYSISPSGALGIPQVMMKYHRKYINELGYSEERFIKNPNEAIIIGFKIFQSYMNTSNNSYKVACKKYSGGHRQYFENVHKKFNNLRAMIHEVKPGFAN